MKRYFLSGSQRPTYTLRTKIPGRDQKEASTLMSEPRSPLSPNNLLAASFEPEPVVACLSAHPKREIAEALRDRDCIQGANNILICEALYLTGTSPWVPVSEVKVGKILDTLRLLAITNRDLALAATTGTRRAGLEFYVHARAQENCRRCRGKIAAAMQGTKPNEHITYFCPTCQPGEHPPILERAARRPASKTSR